MASTPSSEREDQKLTPDDAEWWAEHGISEKVRDARPYERWTPENREPVRRAYQGLTPLSEACRRGELRRTQQSTPATRRRATA